MEIKFEENIKFPSITICPSIIIDRLQSWCGVHVMDPQVRPQLFHLNMSDYCSKEKRKQIMGTDTSYYSNDYYNHNWYEIKVTTLDSVMNPVYKNYFRSLPEYNHACVTWNPRGNLTKGKYGFASIHIQLKQSSPSYYILPHGPDEYIDIGQFMSASPSTPGAMYQVNVEGTTLQRLPDPYPSKCRTKAMSETSSLVNKYSRQLCNDLSKPISKLQRCGIVDDFSYPFLDQDYISKSENIDQTFGEFHNCLVLMKEQSKSGQIPDEEDCDPQCSEQKFEVRHQMAGPTEGPTEIELLLSLDNTETENFVVEKALYQFNEVVANVGGMISLLNGLSICSALEILIATGLYIMFKRDGRRTVYTM
uniref:Uncharacterized protein n=1 Tax=Clytia hemisphaerica TaxID=252671 RepID=A0A7M6DR36_9CNID